MLACLRLAAALEVIMHYSHTCLHLAAALQSSMHDSHTCFRLAAALDAGFAARVVPMPEMPVLQSPIRAGTGRPGRLLPLLDIGKALTAVVLGSASVLPAGCCPCDGEGTG